MKSGKVNLKALKKLCKKPKVCLCVSLYLRKSVPSLGTIRLYDNISTQNTKVRR